MKFKKAKPVWVKNDSSSMNQTVGFHGVLEVQKGGSKFEWLIAASAFYRAYCNGEFVGYGPARSAHGCSRVDVWDLSSMLKKGNNVLALEVHSPQVNSFYSLDEPGFVQSEVVMKNQAVLYTSDLNSHWTAHRIEERIQKVHRYSFQRSFVESYTLHPHRLDWRIKTDKILPAESMISTGLQKRLLPRSLALPDFHLLYPESLIRSGTFTLKNSVKERKDRYVANIGPKFKGFLDQEVEARDGLRWDKIQPVENRLIESSYQPSQTDPLQKKQFKIFQFKRNLTGFIRCSIECRTPVVLNIAFDEMLSNDWIDIQRNYSLNVISLQLDPGSYEFESMEPYTLKFLALASLQGDCVISSIAIREYAYPLKLKAKKIKWSSPQLQVVFDAAVETYRQNTVDLYMDCPSRERAGWLCDSYFMARAEFALTGQSVQERHFLENYLYAPQSPYLPEGMLPMCYPSDHNDGLYIPQWSLWFIVELEEYLQRTGDRLFVRRFFPKISTLLKFFKPFENSDGLLESLPGWNFIEWSKANDFTQGVNYPTNMLYSAALAAFSRMSRNAGLMKKATLLKAQIVKESLQSGFFHDQALRNPQGALELQNHRTEACQYYAFFFKIVTPQEKPFLWNYLIEECPIRRNPDTLPHPLHPSNSLMGYYMRLFLLGQNKATDALRKDIIDYFYPMAEKTGTLWEGKQTSGSLNHGFASYVVEPMLCCSGRSPF